MPNTRKVIVKRGLSLLVVALASLWLGWHWLAPKPSFQGKTAAQWFQEMPMDKRGLANAPLQALRQCQPSALPFLYRMAQQQDNLLANAGRGLHPRLPAPIQRWLPLPPGPAVIRHKAIWTLGAWDPPPVDAVPLLTQALQDDQPRVRAQAAEVIRQIGYPARASADALLTLLKDPDAWIRRNAADALYALQSQAWTSNQPLPAVTNAIAKLTPALRDSELGVRIPIATLFWYVGPAALQAKHELIAALRDPDERVRGSALYALGQLGPAAQDAVPEILRAAADPDKQARCFVMQVLPKLAPGCAEIVPALIQGLSDREKLVRGDAAKALSELGPSAAPAVPALVTALKDDYVMVRLYACRALGNVGSAAQAAVPALSAALATEGQANSIAREAGEALRQIKPEGSR